MVKWSSEEREKSDNYGMPLVGFEPITFRLKAEEITVMSRVWFDGVQ